MGRGGGESAECGARESVQLSLKQTHKHDDQISSTNMKDVNSQSANYTIKETQK